MISLIKKLIFKNSCNTQIDIFKDYKFLKLYKKYKQYSMTSIERMYALYKASDYIIKACVPGDIVECGVWKGGSIMLSAAVFLSNKNQKRKFYLYDTFEGLTKPGNRDFDIFGQDARVVWWKNQKWLWTSVSEQEVRKSLSNSEFNLSDFIFVKGDVLNTIPKKIPNKIALLRLDTDWYKSTKHELEHLFPKIADGGVLIIDDYGHFKGAQYAVDSYFKKNKIKVFLNRVDYSCRLAVINK